MAISATNKLSIGLADDQNQGDMTAVQEAGTASFNVPAGFAAAPVDIGGTGPDTVVLTMSEDYFQGDAQFYVTVDGVRVGELQTVTALHEPGEKQDFTLKTTLGSGPHQVGVTFVNDAYAGTAATDRNLYVDAISVNGVDQGKSSALMSNGAYGFDVTSSASAVSAPVLPAPAATVVGSGPQTLGVKVSEDAYQGNATFDISVDGNAVATGLSAQALRSAGATQLFTINGDFGAGPHSVGVTFTNDAYGGTAATDRNLYVDAVSFNGVDQGKSSALMSNGTYGFDVTSPASSVPAPVHPVPSETVVGTGSQVISLKVSEDAYKGDATFDVTVDGKTVATGLSAQALHSARATQLFTIKGDFGAGPHSAGVTFTNDAYGGTAATDRNLYVESIAFDGKEALGSESALYGPGTVSANGSFAAPASSYGATADVGLTEVGTPEYPAGSHTLTVGEGKQFATIAAAVGASRDGDVILVDAGTYTNDFAQVTSKVTLIAVGGRVYMNATVDTPNQKGILVAETDLKVVGFTFSGAHISNDLGHNAAGIRVDNGNIVLINDEFHDNQNGILINPGSGTNITIDHSLFNHNGGMDDTGSGNTHNIYVGDVKSFTMTNSISENAQIGHEVKSRAETNVINNNLIISGVGIGNGSYDIDLPDGGKSTVTNNTIIKGPNAENRTMVHFGGEGIPYAGSSLTVSGNLFQNTADGPTGVLNQTAITAKIANNQLNGISYDAFVQGPATISSTFDNKGVAYSDSVLTGVLPGSTTIFDETDKSAHAVSMTGDPIKAIEGGGGLLSLDIVAGHIIAIGGSGGMNAIESATSGTGGNEITTAAGSNNTIVVYGQDTIDSEGTDSITTHNGNVTGQLNGISNVLQAGAGNNTWGVNGTSAIQTGAGSTFVSLGAAASLSLTGTNDFYKVDSNGGLLTMDTVNSGSKVSGTVTGSYTMQTYGGTLHMTTAGGSNGVVMTMGSGDVQFVSKGADEFHAGSGYSLVQVAGNARIYAGSGKLDFFAFGSSGADLYGNGGTYYLGGDTGNITYHGGDLASTLNDDLGRGTILGGAGRLTINGSARDHVVGGSGGLVLNQNGGGADSVVTAAGSTNVLNLTGGSDVTSNGVDTINWGPANGTMVLNGRSQLTVQDGNIGITVAGQTSAVVLAGHDSFNLLSGSTANLDLHGYHGIRGEDASLALHFTNDQNGSSDLRWSGATIDAWTDTNGGIHAETSGAGASEIAASGSLSLRTDNAARVTLGTGPSNIMALGSSSVIQAGSGDATISGGGLGGTIAITGSTGKVTADSGSMNMTFIGGSGAAALSGGSGGSVAITAGSGAITATGNGVTSFVGSSGAADISLSDGARVTLGAGDSHFTERAAGSTDIFALTAGSVGNAIIDGFRSGTDTIALQDGVKVTSQSLFGGGAHLLFSNGGDVTLNGVQDLKSIFA